MMNFKKLLGYAVVLCLISVPFTLGEDSVPGASPSVFVPQAHFRFNPIPEGEALVHDFFVQNRGDAPLLIEKVQTG